MGLQDVQNAQGLNALEFMKSVLALGRSCWSCLSPPQMNTSHPQNARECFPVTAPRADCESRQYAIRKQASSSEIHVWQVFKLDAEEIIDYVLG